MKGNKKIYTIFLGLLLFSAVSFFITNPCLSSIDTQSGDTIKETIKKYRKFTAKTDFKKDSANVEALQEFFDETNLRDPKNIAIDFLEKYFSLTHSITLKQDDYRITKVQETPGGTKVRFEQMVEGIPVYLTGSIISVDKNNKVSSFEICFRPEVYKKQRGFKTAQSLIGAKEINNSVKRYLELRDDAKLVIPNELNWFETNDHRALLTWKVSVDSEKGFWELFINAENGEVVQSTESCYFYDGYGKVFKPDPLTSARASWGAPYLDNLDADSFALNNQRRTVILKDITYNSDTGEYILEGPYVQLKDNGFVGRVDSPYTDTFPIVRNDPYFYYTRNQQEFEAVMCYYYIDESARYLIKLGYFDDGLLKIKVDPHGLLEGGGLFQRDNGFIHIQEQTIDWYDRDVDAGEDATVILHEYGHAIEHYVGPGLTGAGGEAMCVWEGFADYWAASYKAAITAYQWDTNGYWFSRGGTKPELARKVTTNSTYPCQTYMYKGSWPAREVCVGALMDIYWKLGKDITDRLYLEAMTNLTSIPSLPKAGMALIQADYDLYNGVHRDEILSSLDKFGLVQYVNEIPYKVVDANRDLLNGYSRNNDFDVAGADGADNEHFLHLNHAARLNISTSSPHTNFDTKLQIFTKGGIPIYYADHGTGPDPSHAMMKRVLVPAGDFYIVVDGNNGELGDYELSVDYAQPLEVYTSDQRLTETNRSKPAFFVRNTGSEALSDFRVSYYFQVENGKTPVFEDAATPNCTPTLEDLGYGHYRINFDFTGVTLNPGDRFPADGEIVVRIHYPDWSTWDKTNDYSQPFGTTPALNRKVAVFNSADELIYGGIPDIFPPDPSELELEAYILDEQSWASNAVQPRLYFQNKSEVPLTDFTVRYYFTVENGKTPVVEDYWTPNCAVTLEHLSGAEWCVKLDYAGYTLPAGGRVPENDGEVFGLHYADWSVWEKSNDYSQPTSGSYTLTDKIAVFDGSGTLVYGNEP